MAELPERITFRPGSLAGPMAKKLEATGEGPSGYVRRLIAADCGVDAPEMSAGSAANAETAARANAARWEPKKKRRSRSS